MFIRGLRLNKSPYVTADFVPVTQIFANAFIYPHVTHKVISKTSNILSFYGKKTVGSQPDNLLVSLCSQRLRYNFVGKYKLIYKFSF